VAGRIPPPAYLNLTLSLGFHLFYCDFRFLSGQEEF
jgi:hypothetical protein